MSPTSTRFSGSFQYNQGFLLQRRLQQLSQSLEHSQPLHFLSVALMVLMDSTIASIDGVYGVTMVTGTVFCDQCRDGQISLQDYPLSGMNVTLACPGSGGQYTKWREETTNWVGNYAMKFNGTPDLRGCYTQVSSSGQGSSDCGAATGPAESLRLMFNMFDMKMYTVNPLLAQPAEPLSFCPKSAPTQTVPVAPVKPPPVRHPHQQPPLPRVPLMPPTPFFEASACPHRQWMLPQYRCYWKVVSPDTKVAVIFGPIAANRFGSDMTLWQGMSGRGNPYRTLLREGTTALLNSYNSIVFPYNSFSVIEHMNWALMGSTRRVLHTALALMRANSGTSFNATCRFNACH